MVQLFTTFNLILPVGLQNVNYSDEQQKMLSFAIDSGDTTHTTER